MKGLAIVPIVKTRVVATDAIAAVIMREKTTTKNNL